LNINRSAEYIALSKSHKRAEWEAVRLEDERESRRKWELCSEISAELERVAAALTPDQRKNAEKVLKQWEREQSQELKEASNQFLT
jgi:hypothetical protein